MAKKKTTAKKGSSALVPIGEQSAISSDWADKLKNYATEDEATATGDGGWGMISLNNGQFTFEDAILDSPLNVVILGARFENLLYQGKYDPNKMTGVTCYAIGDDLATLAPPADLDSKESELCATCPKNVFGSDTERGKGKACANKVRLALVPFDTSKPTATELLKQDGARLRIPPTGLKAWSVFVKKITKALHRPLFSIVSSLTVSPDTKNNIKLEFDALGQIDNPELLTALESRLSEAKDNLELPPALASPEEETAARPGRSDGVTRKRVVKKSSGAGKKKAPSKKAPSKKASGFKKF